MTNALCISQFLVMAILRDRNAKRPQRATGVSQIQSAVVQALRVSENCEPVDVVQLSCDWVTCAQLTLDVVPRTIERMSISTRRGDR